MESVRDLQVSPEITQYTELEDDFEKTSDILLLVRPDYTIFDEIRTSDDFQIFADMRLAGVGMIGVVHASSALDAIQRFIRRVELGLIPSIIDTVVFVKNGGIDEILKLEMTVKTPHGMRDADLARPVVEVLIQNQERKEINIQSHTLRKKPIGKEILIFMMILYQTQWIILIR